MLKRPIHLSASVKKQKECYENLTSIYVSPDVYNSYIKKLERNKIFYGKKSIPVSSGATVTSNKSYEPSSMNQIVIEEGRIRLPLSKKNTNQTDNGNACENAALELIETCLDCDTDLCKEKPCTKASDLYCPNCGSKYQVKAYGPGNHGQLTEDYILKQGGGYKVMIESMTKSNLRYIVILYNEKKEVIRSVLSDIVKPSDIVYIYGCDGKKKIRIKLNSIYDVTYTI